MTAETAPPRTAHGRVGPVMALVTGLGAGVVATRVQIALWWLAGMPLPETLFRNARLTAALVMGIDVLPPPSTPQWNILLVSHADPLSSVRCLCPDRGALGQSFAQRIGSVYRPPYGLAIYVVNLYGFTLMFPSAAYAGLAVQGASIGKAS